MTIIWKIRRDGHLFRMWRDDGVELVELTPCPRILLERAIEGHCEDAEICRSVCRQVDEFGEATFSKETLGGPLRQLL